MVDTMTWCVSTDLEETKKGPQINLALGGVARDLVREIPLYSKINGAMLGIGTALGAILGLSTAWAHVLGRHARLL